MKRGFINESITAGASMRAEARPRPLPFRNNSSTMNHERGYRSTMMRPALKLNAIEQEHLQELYDAAGVARDELPYTEQFTQLCQDFQDRAFKNADPEQV